MKKKQNQLIIEELLNTQISYPRTSRRISLIYSHRQIVDFMHLLISKLSSLDDKELLLNKLKTILLRIDLEPNPDQLRVNPDLFEQMKPEQKKYDPLKWIEAELNLISYIKSYTILDKDILTEDDLIRFFGSRSTLWRRIRIDHFPCAPAGDKKLFSKDLIIEWIKNRSDFTVE